MSAPAVPRIFDPRRRALRAARLQAPPNGDPSVQFLRAQLADDVLERLAFMQDATRKALTDPDMIAEGEKSMRYIEYQDAAQIRQLEQDIFKQLTPSLTERMNAVIKKIE